MKILIIMTDRFISIGRHAMTVPSHRGFYQPDTRKLKEILNKEKNKAAGKVFKTLIVLCMALMTVFNVIKPVEVQAQTIADFWIEDLSDEYTKRWIVHDGDEEHVFIKDLETLEVIIDGETIPYTVEEMALPQATINYSSARNISYYVEWRETVSLTLSAILFIYGTYTQTDTNNISDALSTAVSYLPAIYVTYTQYDSVESYYSSYEGVYYHKCINLNRRLRFNSSTATPAVYLSNGSWFDPIRP